MHLLQRIKQIYNDIWDNSLEKGPENRASTTKGKKTASRQVGEAETRSHQGKNHTPAVAIHIERDLKSMDLCPEE